MALVLMNKAGKWYFSDWSPQADFLCMKFIENTIKIGVSGAGVVRTEVDFEQQLQKRPEIILWKAVELGKPLQVISNSDRS